MGKLVYIDIHRAGGAHELHEKMRAGFEATGHSLNLEICRSKKEVLAASGEDWLLGFMAYFFADMGLAMQGK